VSTSQCGPVPDGRPYISISRGAAVDESTGSWRSHAAAGYLANVLSRTTQIPAANGRRPRVPHPRLTIPASHRPGQVKTCYAARDNASCRWISYPLCTAHYLACHSGADEVACVDTRQRGRRFHKSRSCRRNDASRPPSNAGTRVPRLPASSPVNTSCAARSIIPQLRAYPSRACRGPCPRELDLHGSEGARSPARSAVQSPPRSRRRPATD
jgi:hypothetical protein